MSHSLSSWLNHIKSDDIDGGLAADFDGSLSGLGADLSSNAYNMSEALLALPPVFKQETAKSRNAVADGKADAHILPSFSGYTSGRSLTLPGRSSPTGSTLSYQSTDMPISGTHSLSLPNLQQHCADSNSIMADTINTEWVSLMTSMNLGEVGDVEDSCESRFQYILNAATSPATRMSEETLTYLNQGQSYEIKLKRLKEGNDPDEQLLKSIVRVVFHERRLQYMEKEQLDVWKLTRPGERIVDIDIPMCRGLLDVKIDPHRLNCVEFVWDPRPQVETKVAIKIHCISTEFTAKKHGGEKGVPFRIQVETYTHSTSPTDNVPLLLNCASCQVKVFKPKGADRKHKTDREKIERRSTSEKEKYQPSYECTVLTEIPLDQVHKYLELLNRQQDEDERRSKETTVESSPVAPSPPAPVVPAVVSLRPAVTETIELCPSFADTIVASPPDPKPLPSPVVSVRPTTPSTSTSSLTLSRKRPSETCLSVSLNHTHSSVPPPDVTPSKDSLLATATAEEVAAWLSTHRFANFLHIFQDFSGSDLLRLNRDDLIQICGTADGIRLFNALQAKSVRPKLTLYVCVMTSLGSGEGSPLIWADVPHANPNHVKFQSRSSTPSPPPFFITDPAFLKADHRNLAKSDGMPGSVPVARDNCSSSVVKPELSRAPRPDVVVRRAMDVMSGLMNETAVLPAVPPAAVSSSIAFVTTSSSSIERREMASQTCLAAKRQMTERDEDEDDEISPSLSANKKQRMQSLELTQREVYHALYLDSLTEYNLREKLAFLYDILPTQISELFLQGPSGIHILVTDLVVQNFKDHSSFVMGTVPDSSNAGQYRIVLRCMDVL